MEVETWPIDRPKPYEHNPRDISKIAVDKVAKSIKEFGWRQPIVVDESDVIIAGHTRLLAAKQLGAESVPVHVARGLSKAQIRAYRLADNRTGEETTWNPSDLARELGDLGALNFDLGLTGFDMPELSHFQMFDKPPTDPNTEWTGMPEFAQEDQTAFRTIHLHFPDQESIDKFAKLVGQKIGEKTKSLWYPEQESVGIVDKRYAEPASTE